MTSLVWVRSSVCTVLSWLSLRPSCCKARWRCSAKRAPWPKSCSGLAHADGARPPISASKTSAMDRAYTRFIACILPVQVVYRFYTPLDSTRGSLDYGALADLDHGGGHTVFTPS